MDSEVEVFVFDHGWYLSIIEQLVTNSTKPLSEYLLVGKHEPRRLLQDWNRIRIRSTRISLFCKILPDLCNRGKAVVVITAGAAG
jgi:hypothetical protein